MTKTVIALAIASALVVGAAGCASSGKKAAAGPSARTVKFDALKSCLHDKGYKVMPEPSTVRGTAPRNFEFIGVWNLLNPNRVALALTISKSPVGARRAEVWTRKANDRIGKGVVRAPVVRFGRINVLWTTDPDKIDKDAIYGCVRASSLGA